MAAHIKRCSETDPDFTLLPELRADQSEQGIDERRQDRSFGEDRQGPIDHSHHHERHEPELLPVPGEAPQIDKNAQRNLPWLIPLHNAMHPVGKFNREWLF
jgi:hypothetical protein